jgi:hypothetical protein
LPEHWAGWMPPGVGIVSSRQTNKQNN